MYTTRRRPNRAWLSAALALAIPMALTLPASAASAQANQGPDDATIVAIFDAANTADIETGQLAGERARSQEVKDYGAMLVRDHRQVRQMGRDLAAKLGVTPTPPTDDQGARNHALVMRRLREVPAADFDRAFLQHEVAFHKEVLDAMNSTLIPAIDNAELKDLVEKVAPAFQAHMMAAQALLDKLD
jgi:putative membrane protein